MNPLKALRLFGLYEQATKVVKEKEPVKVKIPELVKLISTTVTLFGGSAILQHFFGLHPSAAETVTQILVGLQVIGHVIAPSIIADASSDAKQSAGLKAIPALLLALLFVPTLHAQTTIPEGTLPTNIYAIGPSYNPSASPAIAGSAFYGRMVAGTGTYGFTVLDALPSSVKPFTISTNIGAGVAQKLLTIGSVPFYGAAGTGISWSGSNTDWQWNGGALAAIPLRKACSTCYLMPNARFLSVGGGKYQPIVGFWFGFGS